MLSPVREDYLKAIHRLQGEGGDRVRTSAIAEHLEVSESSVSTMVKELAEDDLVDHEEYAGVTLTPTGRSVALEVVRHHRLLEAFLSEELDYDWSEVHEEADRLEHHISERFIQRVAEILDHPTVDPHGDPIPNPGLEELDEGETVRLSACGEGDAVVIERVSDRDPEVLRYLGEHGLRPGVRVTVVEVAPFDMLTVAPEGGDDVALPGEVAEHVRVRPAGATSPA
jgi:DtxR family Mn-dependent transcriptional regulator